MEGDVRAGWKGGMREEKAKPAYDGMNIIYFEKNQPEWITICSNMIPFMLPTIIFMCILINF